MRSFIIILFLLHLLPGRAQNDVTISGVVQESETCKALEAVNVMLQSCDGKFMYGVTLTDAEGKYSIQYKGKRDTLAILISGFNVKGQKKIIQRTSQQINFMAESTSINIKEIVVKPRTIERTGDTISYNVNSFKALTDYSIGDVLRKLPGIDVDKNGQIRYNGLAISKFYVEGMDMFEGRYSIATNNIQAKDIASVEVLENHQPIKALKELSLPENAAINLRLKEESKGIWGGILKAGAGYKPTMWNAETTAMYFGRNFQNMNIYKSNNTGNDISNELLSHNNDDEELSPLTGILQPSTPRIDKQRYLDNSVHLANTNAISHLAKDLTLTANAYYMHDMQHAKGDAVSTYYQLGTSPLIISENTRSSLRKDHTGASLKVESNKESFYLKDRFAFAGEWNRDKGNVFNGSEDVKQNFDHSRVTLKNQFQGLWKTGDFSINIISNTDYGTLPTTLQVSPMLYPEIFNGGKDIAYAVQTLDSKRFRTQNQAYTSFDMKQWSFYINVSANAELEWMQSALQPAVSNNHTALPAISDMKNDAYWRRMDLSVGPSISYKLPNKLWINFGCPFDFMNLKVQDKIRDSKDLRNRLFLRPLLSAQAQLTQNLKIAARASYHESYGGINDSYGGFIMTDYRIISNKSGELNHTKNQQYSLGVTYADILRSLFGSMNITYLHSELNLMYGTSFEGTLSSIQAMLMPNSTDSYNVHGNISKYLSSIRTTLNLSGTYSRSWNDVLRQKELMKVSLEYITAGLGANIRFCPSVLLDYRFYLNRSISHIETEENLSPIDMLQQNATLSFILHKKIAFSVSGEHYYNSTIQHGNRNMFFADAKIAYHKKRVEYSLHARNLLAKRYFYSARFDDATGYTYTYQLRPPSIMFNIGFNL